MDFVKISDENIAEQLIAGGFFCTVETFNTREKFFVFENTNALWEKIDEIMSTNFSGAPIVSDSVLNF